MLAAALVLPATARAQLLENIPGVSALHWVTGVHTLPSSGAILTVPPNAKLLLGADAHKLDALLGGGDPTTEATLRLTRIGTVEYEFCNCGFTIPDDWECMNFDDVAASIARYYRQNGWNDVLGFARPPVFDRSRATITYMLRLQAGNGHEYYEGDAMVLGRNGFETIVSATRKTDAASTWSTLQVGLAAFRFANGHQFGDRQPGDKTNSNHLAATFVEKAGADDLFETYYYSCRATSSPSPAPAESPDTTVSAVPADAASPSGSIPAPTSTPMPTPAPTPSPSSSP
jgi:hypothetical protein